MRLASSFVDTKENSVLRIYYRHDEFLIFNNPERSILYIAFFVLDNCLIKVLGYVIKISQYICQRLSVLNVGKEGLQLIHGINGTCDVLITYDGCNSLCKSSYLFLQLILNFTCLAKFRSTIPQNTEEKFILSIYLGKDKFLILNVTEGSVNYSSIFILNCYFIKLLCYVR